MKDVRSSAGLLTAVGALAVTLVVALAAASTPALAPVRPLDGAAPQLAPAPGPPAVSASPTPTAESGLPDDVLTVFPAWLVVALAVALILMLFLVRARPRRLSTPPHSSQPTADDVLSGAPTPAPDEVIEESLSRLRAGSTTGDAEIIRCWRTLEGAGAVLGIERDPAQTVHEYVRNLSACTNVDPDALSQLASLYQAAVFSGRASTTIDQQSAVACLERLTPGLEQR